MHHQKDQEEYDNLNERLQRVLNSKRFGATSVEDPLSIASNIEILNNAYNATDAGTASDAEMLLDNLGLEVAMLRKHIDELLTIIESKS